MSDDGYNEFTDYKRFPIWINPHAIALIQVFKRNDNLKISGCWITISI